MSQPSDSAQINGLEEKEQKIPQVIKMSSAKAERVAIGIKEKVGKIEEYDELITKKAREVNYDVEKSEKKKEAEKFNKKAEKYYKAYKFHKDINKKLEEVREDEIKRKILLERETVEFDEFKNKKELVKVQQKKDMTYLNDVVNLVKDEQRTIVNEFKENEKLKKAIEEIQIKKEKVEKEIKELEEIEKSSIVDVQSEINSISEEEKKISTDLEQSKEVLKKTTEEKESLVNETNKNVGEIQKEIKSKEIELEKEKVMGEEMGEKIAKIKKIREKEEKEFTEFSKNIHQTEDPIDAHLNDLKNVNNDLLSKSKIDAREQLEINNKNLIADLDRKLKENEDFKIQLQNLIEEEKKLVIEENEKIKRERDKEIETIENELRKIDPDLLLGSIKIIKNGFKFDRRKTESDLSRLLVIVDGKTVPRDQFEQIKEKPIEDQIIEQKLKIKKLIEKERTIVKEFKIEEKEKLMREIEENKKRKEENEKKLEEQRKIKNEIIDEKKIIDQKILTAKNIVTDCSKKIEEIFGIKITKIDESVIEEIERMKKRVQDVRNIHDKINLKPNVQVPIVGDEIPSIPNPKQDSTEQAAEEQHTNEINEEKVSVEEPKQQIIDKDIVTENVSSIPESEHGNTEEKHEETIVEQKQEEIVKQEVKTPEERVKNDEIGKTANEVILPQEPSLEENTEEEEHNDAVVEDNSQPTQNEGIDGGHQEEVNVESSGTNTNNEEKLVTSGVTNEADIESEQNKMCALSAVKEFVDPTYESIGLALEALREYKESIPDEPQSVTAEESKENQIENNESNQTLAEPKSTNTGTKENRNEAVNDETNSESQEIQSPQPEDNQQNTVAEDLADKKEGVETEKHHPISEVDQKIDVEEKKQEEVVQRVVDVVGDLIEEKKQEEVIQKVVDVVGDLIEKEKQEEIERVVDVVGDLVEKKREEEVASKVVDITGSLVEKEKEEAIKSAIVDIIGELVEKEKEVTTEPQTVQNLEKDEEKQKVINVIGNLIEEAKRETLN